MENQTPGLLLPTSSPSPDTDEVRLARVAGMLDVCSSDPEQGLEFVKLLQAFLLDELPAVVALALRAIAALCRGDCLDFDVALRIVNKKGKVAHTGASSSPRDWGDPLVMASLAELCGSGAEAEIFSIDEAGGDEGDETDNEEDGSEDHGPSSWGMQTALEVLLGPGLLSHPKAGVRAAVFRALLAHIPALLQAEVAEAASGDGENDTLAVAGSMAMRVRSLLVDALTMELDSEVRPELQQVVGAVLAVECEELSTWLTPSKRKGRGATHGSNRDGGGGTGTGATPSRRLLAVLPTPSRVLQAFREDEALCPGLAGAVLWSHDHTSATGIGGIATSVRDEMFHELKELLAGEDSGDGLGACAWQRSLMPLGLQSYLTGLVEVSVAAEIEKSAKMEGGAAALGGGSTESDNSAGPEAGAAAIATCQHAIANLRGVSPTLVAIASASLVSCVSASFSHLAVDEVRHAMAQVRSMACISPTRPEGLEGTLLATQADGLALLRVAVVARALPKSAAALAFEAFSLLEATSCAMAAEGREGVGLINESSVFWSTASVGIVSEWALRNPDAREAKLLLSSAAMHLFTGLGEEVGSEHVVDIATNLMDGKCSGEGLVVPWGDIDVEVRGRVGGEEDHANKKGVLDSPSTSEGLRCLGLHFGLKSVMSGMQASGMHSELLQAFHLVRALQAARVCGAALALPTAVAECLSCGLVSSPDILDCLRSLSLDLDNITFEEGGLLVPVAQDTCLGVAGLIAVCDRGGVALPPGFASHAFASLERAATSRTRGTGGGNVSGRGVGDIGRDSSGGRSAALLALGTFAGSCLMGPGPFVPRYVK
ncbi:unnamed protein product, partial [Choristocarpus tenellus]